FHGSIVAEGYGAAEPNGNGFFQPVTWTTDDGGLLQFGGGGRYGFTPGAFPTNVAGAPVNRYAAGTFQFAALGPVASGPGSATAAYNSALGGLGTSYRDVVLADAPAAYWRLDETSPAQPAHDEAGGHDAAYQNFTAADLGQPGALSNDTSTSAHFNGVDHYVS